MNRSTVLKLLPIMLAFGVMGFIDIVGVATSYVKEQYSLSDSIANLLPSMAMIWFVLISLPTSVLMGKIGRKNTVLLSFKLTVGRIAISDGEMTTNEAVAHFKTNKPEINEYLFCYLKDFNFQTMGSTSSIATAVNSKIIKMLKIALQSVVAVV